MEFVINPTLHDLGTAIDLDVLDNVLALLGVTRNGVHRNVMSTGRLSDPIAIQFRPSERDYSNTAERRFAETAREHGWAVSKRGWPDFLCFKDGELIAVEVKPDQGPVVGRKPLRLEQSLVLRWLARHGIKCYVWSPRKGFERIKSEINTGR